MRRAAVLGVGQVSAAGSGVDALRESLGAGPTPADWVADRATGFSGRIPVLRARVEGMERHVEPRVLRRLDPFSQRFVLAAKHAIADAGAAWDDSIRNGIVVATGFGPLATGFGFHDSIIDEGDGFGSPTLFSSSVHNAPASSMSTVLGVRGPSLTLTRFQHAWASAVQEAIRWLCAGRVDRVLVAAGDEYHETAGYGLLHLGGWSEEGRVSPLAFSRCSYVPGETAVVLVLGRDGDPVAPKAWIETPTAVRADGGLPSPSDDPLFLGAKGILREGASYRSLARGRSVAAFASVWGCNPTSDAMDAVAAIVALRDGEIRDASYAGDSDPGVVAWPSGRGAFSAVECVSVDGSGRGFALRISRADAGSEA